MALTPLMLNTEDELDGNDLHFGLRTFPVGRYGAVGDDTTDDTTFVQAAIDAAVANGGGIIKFLSKTYKITDQLSVAHCNNIRFEGEDKRTLLHFTDTATKGIVINTTTPSPVSSALTVNAAIGDRTVTVANGGLFSTGVWAYLEDNQTRGGSFLTKVASVAGNVVTLEGALPVALLTASTATLYSYQTRPLVTGFKISNIKFLTDSAANKLTLLQLNRADAAQVENCQFSGAVAPLITTLTCFNVRISNCDFENSNTVAGTGIELQNSTGCVITHNNFEKCTFGITFSASPYGITYGNVIKNRNTGTVLGRGIKYQDQSNRGVISNNTISDMNLFGIYLQDSAYCSVSGNTISDCGVSASQHGIQVGGFEADFCHHNTISNNIISGCTGYGVIVNPTSGAPVNLYNVISGNNVYNNALGGIALTSGASKNVISGNFCHGPNTTVGGVIRVTDSAVYNVISGNNITMTSSVAPAITTTGSGGFNQVFGNVTEGTTGLSLHADDLVGATLDDVTNYSPRQNLVNSTPVATGANTTETNAWVAAIPAAALSLTTHGIHMRGIFTCADNANVKTMRVKLGASSFDGLIAYAPGSAFKVGFTMELSYLTNTTAFVWVEWHANILPAGRQQPGFTNANVSSLDFAAGFDITVTIQNGTASAADITWHGGKLTFEGVRSA